MLTELVLTAAGVIGVLVAGWWATRGLLTAYFTSLLLVPPLPLSVAGGTLQLADLLGAAVLVAALSHARVPRGVGLSPWRWFAAYLVVGALSVAVSAMRDESLATLAGGSLRILRLVFGLAAVALVWQLQAVARRNLLRSVTLCAILSLLVGIFLFVIQVQYPWPNAGQVFYFSGRVVLRAQGVTADPSAFALLGALVIVVALRLPGLLPERGPLRSRSFVGGVALVAVTASGSRTGIAAVLFVLAFVFLRRSRGSRAMRAFAAIVVVLVAVALFGRSLAAVALTRLDGVRASDFDSLLSGRLTLWRQVLGGTTPTPSDLLLGTGYRSFRATEVGTRSDNAFISSLVETGVVGLLVYARFCYSWIRLHSYPWAAPAFVVIMAGSLTNDFQTFWRLVPLLLLLPLAPTDDREAPRHGGADVRAGAWPPQHRLLAGDAALSLR